MKAWPSVTRLPKGSDDRWDLVGSPLRSDSSVGLARRRSLSLFGPVVTVKTHRPSGHVVMAFTLGDFLETLATDDAANSLLHTKHPTWSLKVGLVRP
jgi:hypothetical protein